MVERVTESLDWTDLSVKQMIRYDIHDYVNNYVRRVEEQCTRVNIR